jgi:outer membrane murein-binding lipoprotein Lpp
VESVIAALVSGLLTLVGVLFSNSRSRLLTEAKIEALTKQVEKHNCLIERTFNLERDMAVARNDIDALKREDK